MERGSEQVCWHAWNTDVIWAPCRAHVQAPRSGVFMGLERGFGVPKSCLPISPSPVGFLRELFTRGLKTNGKSKNHFIIS